MNLPHHVSTSHLPMPRSERAAQFAPFAALSGYDDLLATSAAKVRQAAELPAETVAKCQRHLTALKARLADKPAVTVCYVEPASGEVTTVTVRLRDITASRLILTTGQEILLEHLQMITAVD